MGKFLGERRSILSSAPAWQVRDDIVRQAFSLSIPWFAFVNVCFALMIYFRNTLFNDFDRSVHAQADILPVIDAIAVGIMAASAVLGLLIPRILRGISSFTLIFLLIISMLWSYCSYYFIVWWSLPFAWPLTVILMLTALAALYYHLPALLTFLLPIWGTALLASIRLNQGISLRFLMVWLTLTVIIIYGRHILQRWFDEAWQRYQQNRLLIARLDVLAHQDALTGTANRRSMESYLQDAVRQGLPFALIMLDVDYFKRYNDHYGHQAGDTCLAKVADILKSSVRTPADLVARYGGEEFVVVLPSASLDEAAQVAERIQATLRETALPHAASAVSESVTVSMGIALSGPHDNAEGVITRADEALYRAKQQGRNRWEK